MSEAHVEEMRPIDYMVLEWPSEQRVTGEVMPLLAQQARVLGG